MIGDVSSLNLVGSKARLRSFTSDDIQQDYIDWLNDPVVTRFSNQRFRQHDFSTSRAYLDSFRDSSNLFLAIEHVADHRMVGTMTVYVAVAHETADIGILVGDQAVRGTGLAADAWRLITDWLLTEGNLRKVTCGTLDTNIAMKRLAERCGMVADGRRAGQEIFEGEPTDIVYYAQFGVVED